MSKITVHVTYYAACSMEVDPDTGTATMLTTPCFTNDSLVSTSDGPEKASRAELIAIALLHQHVAHRIAAQAEKQPAEKPIPLVNVLAGKASA